MMRGEARSQSYLSWHIHIVEGANDSTPGILHEALVLCGGVRHGTTKQVEGKRDAPGVCLAPI